MIEDIRKHLGSYDIIRRTQELLAIHFPYSQKLLRVREYLTGFYLNGGGEEKTEASDEEIDDEYLPACCRNGQPHKHPV